MVINDSAILNKNKIYQMKHNRELTTKMKKQIHSYILSKKVQHSLSLLYKVIC